MKESKEMFMQKAFLFSHDIITQRKKLEMMEFATMYEETRSNNSSKKTRKVSGRPELEQFHHHSSRCLYKKISFSSASIKWHERAAPQQVLHYDSSSSFKFTTLTSTHSPSRRWREQTANFRS